jgi:hypothetical protein
MRARAPYARGRKGTAERCEPDRGRRSSRRPAPAFQSSPVAWPECPDFDAKRHAQLADAFGGHDPAVCALVCHALGLSLRGLPDQARRTGGEGFTACRILVASTEYRAWPQMGGVFVNDSSRPPGLRADRCAVRGACGEFDLPTFRWAGRYSMGWAKAQGLTLSEGLALMEEAFPPLVNELLYKFFGAALAEARFDAGRVTDALALVDHALNTGEGPASGLFAPEIHRLRGMFLKSLGSPAEEIECALRTALEIAEEQGAFLLKLRASTSLARLWRDQGKVQQARELLAPVYGWFTEGFETRDLKEAKTLLEELAA